MLFMSYFSHLFPPLRYLIFSYVTTPYDYHVLSTITACRCANIWSLSAFVNSLCDVYYAIYQYTHIDIMYLHITIFYCYSDLDRLTQKNDKCKSSCQRISRNLGAAGLYVVWYLAGSSVVLLSSHQSNPRVIGKLKPFFTALTFHKLIRYKLL